MDYPQPNPTHPNDEPDQIVQQLPHVSAIESLLPTANANQLLELLAQGHNPNDLHQLIQINKAA